MLAYVHIRIGLGGNELALSPTWRLAGLLLMLIFSAALIYSLYIEIPFAQGYLGSGDGQLVTTGTYALCRHPGVLWYAFFAAGLVLASSQREAIFAAPIWISMNILFAWLQDRYYFPRLFPGYSEYKNTTPFLIPTQVSIKHFRKKSNI